MTAKLAQAATEARLTIEQLRKFVRCDFETGELFWLERTPDMFAHCKRNHEWVCKIWNRDNAGKRAFSCSKTNGYWSGTIFNECFRAHRVVWALYYGEWPAMDIDHIDGSRGNNAVSNLRQATRSQNSCNRGKTKSNTSGYKGVFWDRNQGNWSARITHNNVRKYLGNFESALDAKMAYQRAAAEIHGEFARS